jgi:hypothetical protein
MVSRVDQIVHYGFISWPNCRLPSFSSNDCRLLKKSPATVDLWPKVDCRLQCLTWFNINSYEFMFMNLRVYGFVWIYMNRKSFFFNFWIYILLFELVNIRQFVWIYMDLSEFMRINTNLRELMWIIISLILCINSFEFTWIYVNLCESLWMY